MEAHTLINNYPLRCFFEALWIVRGWREEVPINGLIAFVSIVMWRKDAEGRTRNMREIADLSGISYPALLRFSRELETGRDKVTKGTEEHRAQSYRYGGPTMGALIKRKQDPFDRRNNIVELTARGERLAEQIIHALKGAVPDADQAALPRVPGNG